MWGPCSVGTDRQAWLELELTVRVGVSCSQQLSGVFLVPQLLDRAQMPALLF